MQPPSRSGARSKLRAEFCSPYQRYDFLSAWQHHAGRHEHGSPCIVIAVDAEQRPLVLLPLVLTRAHGVRVAAFMGGKHTTFNMGLWDRDFAASASRADLDHLLAGLRAHDAADVLALTQQPLVWHDLRNPFALLPRQPSVNDCPMLAMPAGAPADRADLELLPQAAEEQGEEAAGAGRLPLFDRDH